MSTMPLDASYTRCLAHTHQRNEWCPRRETCARQISIRHDNDYTNLHIKERLCVSNELESFVSLEDIEPEQRCTYPHCNCPFDAPADPNWCARGLKKGAA